MFGKLLAAALLAFAPIAQNPGARRASQPPVQPIPAERAADSYAIYSLLLPGAPEDKISPSQIHNWAIADTTVNITDMDPAIPPNGQLKAPPDNSRAFNDALHDFDLHRYQRFFLDANSFSPHRVLPLYSQHQVNDLRQSRPVDSGIVFFSAVYFNDPPAAALVYVNDWCAELCAAGQWVYLEKQGGQWVRRSGTVVGGG